MKICSLYGAGYYYMPGTDICLKFGGYVRYQLNVGAGNNISGGPQHGVGGRNTRIEENNVMQRVRALTTIDTRQQTAYGTLRSYMMLGWSHDVPTSGAAGIYVSRGFVQIAGFTFGKATSFFDIFPNASFSYNAGNNWSGDSGDGGVILMSYTAQFGNGFSGSIAIEQTRRLATAYTVGATGTPLAPFGGSTAPSGGVGNLVTGNNHGTTGSTYPDIVANLRLDQSWGTWIVAGALHDISGGYYATSATNANEAFGHPDDKWGFAVTTGFILNLPMITPGDRFSIQAVYSQGATAYHGATRSGANPAYFSGERVAYGWLTDGVFSRLGQVSATTAWSIAGAFEHLWTPSLKTSWYGSYIDVSHNAQANAEICAGNGVSAATSTNTVPAITTTSTAVVRFNNQAAGCNADWSAWTAGSRTEWEPVKGLTFGVDVIYQQINSMSANGNGRVTMAQQGGKPAANYFEDDLGVWSGSFRVQRNFLP